MKMLMKLAALGAIGVGLRKVMAQRGRPEATDTTDLDLREPQKTVEDIESTVGEPVRP